MKANELKKDKSTTVRINEVVLEALKVNGHTPQTIVDGFIERNISLNVAPEVNSEPDFGSDEEEF